MRALVTAAAVCGTILVGGCGGSEEPPPDPPPTSVREADPCAFLPESVVAEYDLVLVSEDAGETSRRCSWDSPSFSLMILFTWDEYSLVDFSEVFPDPHEDDADLDGEGFLSKSRVRPACAALLFAGKETVVQVLVGDLPPSTADAACERVVAIGTPVVQELRAQDLLGAEPTASPPE